MTEQEARKHGSEEARKRGSTEAEKSESLQARVRVLLRVPLPERAESFFEAVSALCGADETTLRRYLCPQWVVLAAGRGSRIDRSGRLNKNLDIWFGSRNTLHLACRSLPGDRPPLTVIHPDMARRVLRPDADLPLDAPMVLPEESLDAEKRDFYFGAGTALAIQPIPDGTGGALRSASEFLKTSDAEFVGVAFGDEPFLDAEQFVETLIAHIVGGADATLCGKKPEGVVDKGGLFFDDAGRFMGTKEWYDMTPDEQQRMHREHAKGEAVTNTGVSILRRAALLERFPRLTLHKGGTEYHHVDFFHVFYEDGLKTHAYVYEKEIRSGINRWSNVLEGEKNLDESARREFVAAGVRVQSDAKITYDGEIGSRIGAGCAVAGRVHLGETVRVGSYSHLEDAILTGETSVGIRTRLERTTIHDTLIEDTDDGSPVGAPIRGLATLTELHDCRLERCVVGGGARLARVTAQSTVLPPNLVAQDRHFGVRREPGLGFPYASTPTLWQFAPETYRAGAFPFADKRGTPDWEGLRSHVRRMTREELTPRATADPTTASFLIETVDKLLDTRLGDVYLIDALTPEELWGVIYELSAFITGNEDPYLADKRKSRSTALELLEEFRVSSFQFPVRKDSLDTRHSTLETEWEILLRLDIAANVIDFSSVRMLEKMRSDPNYLRETLAAATRAPLAIDSFSSFRRLLLDGDPKRILWLCDNDGEAVFDLWLVDRLLELGHAVTMAGRSVPAANDVTDADLRAMLVEAHAPLSERARSAYADGQLTVIGSGSNTVGTDLYRATPALVHALREANVVVSKGQGNWFTTRGLRKDVFYLLMSKGVTAERTTGVVADRNATVDGLILAYVPSTANWNGTLREIAVQ